METFEQQEERARTRLRIKPLVVASLIAGVVTFIFPGGGPWMSTEGMMAVMGRILSHNFLVELIAHFALSLAYGLAIASVIYSLPTLAGIALGTLMALPLYGLNYAFFGVIMGYDSNEVHAVVAHVMFALFFSAIYRAMAVQPPRAIGPQPRL